MEMSRFKAVKVAEVELENPLTGIGLGVFFTLLGPEHEVRRGYKLTEDRRFRKTVEKGKPTLIDPADAVELELEQIIECTTGWRQVDKKDPAKTGPFIEFNGELLPFSVENARKLYTAQGQEWIRDGVRAMLIEKENFIVDSSTTPAPGSSGVTA
jgi:hypothetical protein